MGLFVWEAYIYSQKASMRRQDAHTVLKHLLEVGSLQPTLDNLVVKRKYFFDQGLVNRPLGNCMSDCASI